MAVNDELTLPLSKLLKKASVSFCCCHTPLHGTVLLCAVPTLLARSIYKKLNVVAEGGFGLDVGV